MTKSQATDSMITKIETALEKSRIANLIGAKSHPILIELGANDGQDTIGLLRAIPRASIYCFEPDPRPVNWFRNRFDCEAVHATSCGLAAERWALDHGGMCELVNAAIGSRDDMTTFYLSTGTPPKSSLLRDWDRSSSIKRPTGHLSHAPWCKFDVTIRVPVRRLDTWLIGQPHISMIDFIWADIQGAEADLIKGAEETLTRTRYFYTEFYNKELYEGQPNLQEMLEMLPGWDAVAIYDRSNILLQNRDLLSSKS